MRYDMSCFFVYPFLGMLHVFEHDEDVARKYFTRERERERCNPFFVCYGCLLECLSIFIINVECSYTS